MELKDLFPPPNTLASGASEIIDEDALFGDDLDLASGGNEPAGDYGAASSRASGAAKNIAPGAAGLLPSGEANGESVLISGPGNWGGGSQPTITVDDAAAMQAIIDADSVEVGQLFRLLSDGTIRRYEGGSAASITEKYYARNPDGYARFVLTSNTSETITVKHDGASGATGICHSVNGAAPTYTAVAANTNLGISIPAGNGSIVDVVVWPATSATSMRVGNLTSVIMTGAFCVFADVAGLSELTFLNLSSNLLKSIDLSGCTKLADFQASSNKLTTVNLSGLPALADITLSNNPDLTGVALGSLPALETITVSNCNLTALDLAGNTTVTDIYCSGNPNLDTIDVAGCTSLALLYCSNTGISKLNIAGNTTIADLQANNCNLTGELDLSGCSSLIQFNVTNNAITSIDLTGCTSLSFFSAGTNQLTEIIGLAGTQMEDYYGHVTAIDIPSNSFTAAQLNAIYSALPDGTTYGSYSNTINVTGAPGAGASSGSNPALAVGWTVVGDAV